jgi:hypothetical protein
MNSNTTPTDVHVITELDVYESTIRKATSMGDLNASPLAEPQKYSWSDIEMEEQLAQKSKKEEPTISSSVILKEETKEESVPTTTPVPEQTFEDPKSLVEKEQIKELVEKLMTEIMSRNEVMENVKKPSEVESDDDMPDLVEMDSDNDSMPDLVESESDNGQEVNDDMMIAIFKRPSCQRCEAALKTLMAHEESEELEESEESETSEEPDDSDSDYVPSDTGSDDSRKGESSDSDVSEIRTVRVVYKRNAEIPSIITITFVIVVILYILKVMYLLVDASMKNRYHACY